MIRTNDLSAIILKGLKGLSFFSGETVKAVVTAIHPEGNVSLRIKGNVINAKTLLPLDVGQVIMLRVMGTPHDGDLKMKFMGNVKIKKLNQLSSKIFEPLSPDTSMMPDTVRSDLEKTLYTALKTEVGPITKRLLNLIEGVSEVITNEANAGRIAGVSLKSFIGAMEDLGGDRLRTLLENTGILFETRLKMILQDDKSEEVVDILEKDLKANLLRLSKEGILKTEVQTLLRDIETLQSLSRVTDSIYTFLPLIWKDLRDGDISFKRRKDIAGVPSYSCRVNLELERFGRVAIMVILHDKSLFVSFVAEASEFRKILEDNKELLQSSFIDKGLNLKVINVDAPTAESTWPEIADRVDIKA